MDTQVELLTRKLTNENVTEQEISDLLESAKSIILANRYPFEEPPDELENRYKDLQIRIAVELFSKIGVEGEIMHTENGVSRQYSSADVSPALLKEIVPKAKVLK